LKDFKNSFVAGLKIGFNVFVGSYGSLLMFFSFGIIHLTHMLRTEINFLDSFALILCIYNTYWISEVVEIRKNLKTIVHNVLKNTTLKKSDKNFLSDIIFTINWRTIRSLNFENNIEKNIYLEKLVLREIDDYASDKLMGKL
jgi:hypothetical protein